MMLEGTARTDKRTSYPEYKNSGIEWLGDVPAHWEVKRGRFCANVNPQPFRSLHPNSEVSFVPMEAVGEYGGLNLDQKRSVFEVGSGYTEFKDGDVVVAKITPCFENGKGALAMGLLNGIGFGTTELHVLRPFANLDVRFLFYFSISQVFRSMGEGEMYGAGGQKRVPPEFCKDVHIPLPPVEEQNSIADFLDRETAKIDTLVAKKRTLIERLKEERTALITHIVTRGLPPEAARAAGLEPHPKLKSSGIEWLGDMPEHWSSKRLKTISRIRYGLGQPPRELSGGLPLIRATNVIRGRITEKDMVYIDPEDVPKGRDAFLAEKEIIVVRSGAYTADSAIVPKAYDGAVTGYDMVVTVNDALAEFVALAFLCTYVRDGQLIISSMRAAQPHLNAEELGSTVILLPPLSEQTAIVAFLDRQTEKIETLVTKIETAIERLQEYRSALITAAVTGKIDVREKADL